MSNQTTGGTMKKDEKDTTLQKEQPSKQQGQPGQRQSSDQAPRNPAGGGKLSSDEDMDDDTGLSNRANRQSAEQDLANRQSQQSNVGRRDDGTPD
jgi:hypothetical protein